MRRGRVFVEPLGSKWLGRGHLRHCRDAMAAALASPARGQAGRAGCPRRCYNFLRGLRADKRSLFPIRRKTIVKWQCWLQEPASIVVCDMFAFAMRAHRRGMRRLEGGWWGSSAPCLQLNPGKQQPWLELPLTRFHSCLSEEEIPSQLNYCGPYDSCIR